MTYRIPLCALLLASSACVAETPPSLTPGSYSGTMVMTLDGATKVQAIDAVVYVVGRGDVQDDVDLQLELSSLDREGKREPRSISLYLQDLDGVAVLAHDLLGYARYADLMLDTASVLATEAGGELSVSITGRVRGDLDGGPSPMTGKPFSASIHGGPFEQR